MNAFQFIFQYIKRHKVQYTLGIITLFVVDFANIFIPKLTGVITDGLTAHSLDWSGVRLNLLYLFLLGLLLAVGRFFWRYFLFGASRSIEKELRNDMFAHLEKMDVEYYNEHKTGDLMTRFTSDLNAIRMAIGPAVICVFDASVMTIMVIFQMMYYVSVKLTLIAGSCFRPDRLCAGKFFRYPRHQGFCPRKSTALSLFKRKRKHDGKELKHCKDPVHCHSTVRCHHRSFFTAYFNLWRLSRTDR